MHKFWNMKRIFSITITLLLSVWMLAGERQTIVFDVDMHCQGCVTKIEKNIAFERGVKDLVCDLDAKTVMVTFDPAKTDVQHLQAAFAKINKPAKVHGEPVEAEHIDQQEQQEAVDARTGASVQRE